MVHRTWKVETLRNKGGRSRWQSSQQRYHRINKQILDFPVRICSPIWILLLTTVLILTAINVLMSLKLTYSGSIRGSSQNESSIYDNRIENNGVKGWSMTSKGSLYHSSDCPSNDNGTFRFVNKTGRFDNSRKYLIHDFVQVGQQWSKLVMSSSICLATQTSVDQMFWLAEVAHYWRGPLSVSVFVPGEDYHVAIRYIYLMRHCFPIIRDTVSFHFVYPIMHPPKMIPSLPNVTLSCNKWSANLKTLMNLRPRSVYGWRTTLLYPQNHMRNVARKGCQTPFVLLTDVDIIPRWDLCRTLEEFLSPHPPCEHCVFVVPTYEVEENVPLPANKSVLVNLVQRKKAQPFHNVVFINNQFATNASKWEKLEEEDKITVAYPVTNFELYYEPFYVARDEVPPHDERFIGYGYTRNTQVYEMFVANYKFLVLNSAFAMHRGLKLKKVKNSWREKQNRANSRQFKKFEKEILARYGYTKTNGT